MVKLIKLHSDYYVECVSRRGSPQRLVSRFTGQPVVINLEDDPDRKDFKQVWSHNVYYPSPEMQIDAALALKSVCGKIVYSG